MLSLIELQNKKVEAKRKKYEKDEMDAYLDIIFENYKELLEENKKLAAEKVDLNQKIKKLSDGVQYYRSIETTLQKALILAEKTSKETKDAAILKAEAIEKDAQKHAEEIIHTAEGEYDKLKQKCVHLVQQFNQYKVQLKEAASAQLQLVEGEEFDIKNPDELEKKLNVSQMPKTTSVVKEQPTPQPQQAVEPTKPLNDIDTSKEEILNADTIDLRTTLNEVQSETASTKTDNAAHVSDVQTQSAAIKEEKPQSIDNQAIKTAEASLNPPTNQAVVQKASEEKIDVLEEPKQAEVKKAEPVQAKTIEPMDIVFEEEMAASKESDNKLEEPKQKAEETVPTLDSLLQDLNMNNKNDKKSDDPFEFLGSVDDF